MPNQLGASHSAYLRSAAHQPVDWQPWGPEAFARAKAEEKLLLLDIGAVWCHWCHVIDRESYDDPALAKLINELFVPVKVDRDERPDVDARYQAAVQAMTGQGGWPLTAFLTPEGKVVFGGTYFPPTDLHGRPGFRTVLERVAEAWQQRREDMLAHGDHLHMELEKHAARAAPGELDPRMLDAAAQSLLRHFDPVNGGFGTAPKFPHPAAIELALARCDREPALATVARATLEGMARGGVYDQVGGGFHRYSVDAEWVVPHFEKMLYDNAGLLRNYAHAALRWPEEPLFRATAEGIVRWVREVMTDPLGGFDGSQDADVGLDDDGDHWTWTLDELRAAVPDRDLAALLAAHFDVGERGEMHHDPRKNVLFVAKTAAQLAREHGLPAAMVEARLAEGRALMLKARARRPAPVVDKAIYSSWNGMMAAALLVAWRATDDAWAKDAALRALDRILAQAFAPDKGVAHTLRGEGAEVWGLLEDQVWVAHALLEAYQCTGEARYLRAAEELLRFTVAEFQDADGALLDLARSAQPDVPALATRRKPIEDAPSASPNAVGALALGQLASLTGDEAHRAAAEHVLRAFAGAAPQLGLFAGAYFLALAQHLEQAHVIVVGDAADPKARALHRVALQSHDPLLVVQPPAREGAMPAPAREALDSGAARSGPVALVCRGNACSPPARSPEELSRLLAPRTAGEGPAARGTMP